MREIKNSDTFTRLFELVRCTKDEGEVDFTLTGPLNKCDAEEN